MQTLMLTIAAPILFSTVFSILLKQKIVDLIPIVYVFSAIWVYVFSTFDNYKFGLYSVFPFLVLASIIGLYFRRHEISKSALKQDFFSPAVIFFAIVSVWTYFHSKNMKFYEWDEFSYWGSATKTIFSFNQIPALSSTQGAFPEYPPGIPIFGSLFVSAHGIWRESIVFWAYQVLIFSLVASILRDFKWKDFNRFILGLLIALFATVYFYNSYQSVYADPVMSILFGSSIILASSTRLIKNKTYIINFSIIISF